ncbi:MAG: AAA family ATPase [Candidatus Micrarchaeota archaeon]|nr:AAA family ATPase [Candidatus Micrarchaeota archaeon]
MSDFSAGGLGMGRQKILANIQMIRSDENIGGAILVALGTLFMLLSFPFYPIYIVFLLAIATGVIAYKQPPFGTIASMALALPAVAYQAPVLAWVFSMALAITLFEAFEHWKTISFLQVAILMPFAPEPISLLSGFIFLALGIAAMHFGSQHSFAISLPAIFIVLLLSTVWLQPTSSFITISNSYQSLYGPAMDQLQNNGKPAVELGLLISEMGMAFASMFSIDNLRYVSPAIEKIGSNTITLLAKDSALPQLAAWAAALFLCAFLPARFEHRYKQALSSLSLFIVPAANAVTAPAFGNSFSELAFLYCGLSVGAIAVLEHYGFALSQEKKVIRAKKQKAFGKFGLQDLGDSEGVDSLDDVGGYEDVKLELREAIVAPLKQKELTYTYGIKPPNGILLFGPPGTGKTLLMKALAKELSLGFYYVKCSDLLSEWYGESEKNVAEVFAIARKNAPCVLFFDEIDSIGKRRDAYTSDDVAPRIMSVLLEELDGFKGKKTVITIGATNVPDQLDPALMRPGRFDKVIYMHLPDAKAREAIFKVHLSKLPREENIDYGKLAAMTERYSGADIKNICTEASRLAAREALKSDAVVPITMSHLVSTIKKIKPSVSLEQLETYEKFRMDYERRTEAVEKEPEPDKVRWEDVAGLDEVRRILLEAIEIPLLHEELLKEMDVKPPKGLLLFGPPGCGKTMIVKAAVNELKANFLSISGAELMKGKDKHPAAYVKEVFNRARESAPALVFIDEIEALAPSRNEYRGGILTELLQEIDGVKELKNVMIIGATNKPSALDSAILRPGRFDKIIYIPPPDLPARERLFAISLAKAIKGYARKLAAKLKGYSQMDEKQKRKAEDMVADEVLKTLDFRKMAELTEGFSGADIASVCQEVKMQLVRNELAGKITPFNTEFVVKAISGRRPSITQADLNEYAQFKRAYGERK